MSIRIMAIESSGVTITSDFVKTKLLQKAVKSSDVSDSSKALYSSRARFHNKHQSAGKQSNNSSSSSNRSNVNRIQCFNCQQYGHKSTQCHQMKKNKNQTSGNRLNSGLFVSNEHAR